MASEFDPTGFTPAPDEKERAAEPTLPVVVLDDSVVLPQMSITLPVSDEAVAAALEAAGDARTLLLVPRRPEAAEHAPLAEALFHVGVIARVEQVGFAPSLGGRGALLRALVRAEIGALVQTDPYPAATYTERPDRVADDPALAALTEETRATIVALLDARGDVPREIRAFVLAIKEPGHLADNTGYSPDYTREERLELLATFDVAARLRRVQELYRRQIAIQQVQTKIRDEVRQGAERQQREFFLRQQLKAIRKELGEDEDEEADELATLRERIEAAGLPEEARKEAERELKRLRRIPTASPEHQMTRTYIEWLADLPWSTSTGGKIDVAHAREVLDADHEGLEKVKERLMEHLAVKQRRQERGGDAAGLREPILALVGPPGVGKTSLGQSVARALGRKFVRMSLGGLRDEAELRGHRRTYIGALPGRLIQALRRAGANDPVVMLDEVDKLGADWRGDPSSALLEILDPEQNHTFQDHYLGVAFDLSKVLFIATANTMDSVAPALRDRMEVITIPGYTEDEKVAIVQRHLLPKQRLAHGLTEDEVTVEEAAIRAIIRDYTRDAGVRNLERELANVLRKVTRQLAEGATPPVVVTPETVRTALGRPRFQAETRETIDQPGIATGLVWTPVGGDIVFVEAAVMSGSGKLKLTGQLGDVMRESAEAALTAVRARAAVLGIPPDFFATHDIHVHVPSGAVPKDGPSAGITMATTLASAITRRPVRSDLAMTGEITLRGRVLPIGGLKEKALGAQRAGIGTVLLPKKNEPELEELPAATRGQMTFLPVDTIDEVLAVALLPAAAPADGAAHTRDLVPLVNPDEVAHPAARPSPAA
jgi:ATP-dependent Lon protease